MTVDEGSVAAGSQSTAHLGNVMTRLARLMQEQHGDVEGTLQAITSAAVGTVPGAEECSISYVVGRRKIEPRASTSELPQTLDLAQAELGQGPCIDAVWDADVVRSDDMRAERRWPEFAARAVDMGVGSMMCLQLFVRQDHLGAMNLYARTPAAFDGEAEGIARMLAAHAAVALAGAEHETHLRRGMDSRDVIGQAKGVLMERHKLTPDQAFGVLARASQEANRKLTDVALEVTDTGVVPIPRRRD